MADLYDIAIARKLSGGGGGGSSIPLNAITVTLTDASGQPTDISINFTDANGKQTAFMIGSNGFEWSESSIHVDANSTASATVYCLPNNSFCLTDYVNYFANCTVTGSAEIIEVYGMNVVSVSGDCTITIS